MKYWLRPANLKYYDVFKAFEELGTINWRSSNNYSIGDIVYIYCSSPLKRITHKCIVVDTDIFIEDSEYDDKFVINKRPSSTERCIKLKLVNVINKEVTLNDIGIKVCQGPRTITLDQASIIDRNI